MRAGGELRLCKIYAMVMASWLLASCSLGPENRCLGALGMDLLLVPCEMLGGIGMKFLGTSIGLNARNSRAMSRVSHPALACRPALLCLEQLTCNDQNGQTHER